MNPKLRLWGAWALFFGCIVGWPVSAFWFAADEPPFILGLSWIAIWITAVDIIATTDVRVKQEENDAS